MSKRSLHVALVGATGAVGSQLRQLLTERRFPVASLRPLASSRSAGQTVAHEGVEYPVQVPSREAFEGVDVAFFSTSAGVAREWAPVAAGAGALVLDKSSAWRMHPEVPLVIAEVNPQDLAKRPLGIVANPNCSTMQMLVALKPLHDRFGLEQLVVSTYQAISGGGTRALAELDAQLRQQADGETPTHSVLPGILAGNVLSDWSHTDDGFSEEESKIVAESRKILAMPALHIAPTTVRVPVRNGHSQAVWVRFRDRVSRAAALEALRAAPGLKVMDAIGPGMHPQPRGVSGGDSVWVGRVREDPDEPRALFLFVVGDNLRKGAALNALQLAEMAFGLPAPVPVETQGR